MKRLLFVVLMMTCSVSWAGWENTGSAVDGIYYHDKSTKRRNGALVQMWSFTDYFEVQTDMNTSYKSAKYLWKHNCNEETQALVSLFLYADSKGMGSVTFSSTVKERQLEWVPVVPNSIGETDWKIACGKK